MEPTLSSLALNNRLLSTKTYVLLPAGQVVCTVRYFSSIREREVHFKSDLYLITRNLRERFLTKEMQSIHSKWGNLIQKHRVTYKLQFLGRNFWEPPQELSNLP